VKFSNTISNLHSNAILNIKMYSCISLGLKITKIKIPRNIVEQLWHINNVTSYEDFQFKIWCTYDMYDFTFSRWRILPAEPLILKSAYISSFICMFSN
jgi:hypothetical protein